MKLWNTDYMQFLLEKVWRITQPVDMLDFGCGAGYLGTLLLPLLPQGSRYNGVDKNREALQRGESLFQKKGLAGTFIEADITGYVPNRQYGLVTSQAVLHHLSNAMQVLENMKNAAQPGGHVVCIDFERNMRNAALFIEGFSESMPGILGIQNKIWSLRGQKAGIDYHIGLKIPVYLQKLGLKNVDIRLSDCVDFISPENGGQAYQAALKQFKHMHGLTEKNGQNASLEALGLTPQEVESYQKYQQELQVYLQNHQGEASIVSTMALLVAYGVK